MRGQAAEVRILIADDDPIVRQLLSRLIGLQARFKLVGEAQDGVEAVRLVQTLRPDIILLDRLMPNLPGTGALRKIAAGTVRVKVIVVCASSTPLEGLQAIQLGARGILPKQFIRELPRCISCVVDGRYWLDAQSFETVEQVIAELAGRTQPSTSGLLDDLTAREVQIVKLLTFGNTNRDIAQALSISEETVKRHVANIYAKLNVSNRVQVALIALQRRLVSVN